MLTDTHCHIHDAELNLLGQDTKRLLWGNPPSANPNDMIVQAKKQGVGRLICVGTTLADSQRAVAFVQNRPNCWASIGLHPHEAKEGSGALEGLTTILNSQPAKPGVASGGPDDRTRGVATGNKIVAIGETGLDYFYGHSDKKSQAKALRFQIELALTHNLPVIFHVRNAFDDFWPIFDSYQGTRGVLHSFTDSYTNFEQAMQRNLFIGVNGIMTFTKVDEQLQIAKEVPLQKLLLETDAPFLTPKPLRGTVNVPANVRFVADFLADLRGQPLATLATQTSLNAQSLFALG